MGHLRGLGRDESMSKGVHLHQQRKPGHVTKVVRIDALDERGARGGLDGPELRAHAVAQLLAHEWHGGVWLMRSKERSRNLCWEKKKRERSVGYSAGLKK
jgi:hypothetical protein